MGRVRGWIREEDTPSKANVVPLHRAVAKEHTQVVHFLLSCGVNVNKKDDNGRTALHTAAFTNQVGVVRALLERGAQQTPDASDRTPLDLAAIRKHQAVIELLESAQSEEF